MANKKEQAVSTNETRTSLPEAFFNENKKTIMYVSIAVIMLAIAFFCYKSLIAGPREEKASTALSIGQEYFSRDMYEKALNGDSATYPGFKTIATDYSSTKSGNLAKLYAGLCYANLGKWQEAKDFLDSYSPADDAMVSPTAMSALANVYAHLKEIDKAISTFKKAADMANSEAPDGVSNSLAPIFLLQAGILLESQNKNSEALKIYQDIKKTYLNSALVQTQEIDKYIERAFAKSK